MVQKARKNAVSVPMRAPRYRVPQARRFILRGEDTEGLFNGELRGAELTGLLRNRQTARACNIIESVLHSLTTESVDFTRCDFKDNAIRSCQFRDSKFGSSSMAYNTVVNSIFEGCAFQDTDIQNCEFDRTTFIRCDLRNILVKSCTFNQCEFRGCQTNNKVFETCRLTECSFHSTELQVQTVAENFGLTARSLHGTLRDNRGDARHRKLAPNDLRRWVRSDATHPLQKLCLHYFLEESLLDGSTHLDTCLNVASWLPAFRTAGSFAVVLNRWIEFLLWLYERDQLAVHTLIRLHSMTDGLLRALGDRASQRQALATISGVHLSLARPVDNFLIVLEQCAASLNRELALLVEGGESKAHYYRALRPLFDRSPAEITRLTEHNSPWELVVSFASGTSPLLFVALFLATRTRIELARISQKLQDRTKEGSDVRSKPSERSHAADQSPNIEPVFALDFGGSRIMRTNPNFRLKAYLPGNLVAELQLDIGSRGIAKLRKTVKDLL